MKRILFYTGVLLIGSITSCNKNCPQNEKCKDRIPEGVTCQAYFETWLYNSSARRCELKGYSGCSPVGFSTKEECEKCKCR